MLIKNPNEFMCEHDLELADIMDRLADELSLDNIPGGCRPIILALSDGIVILLLFGSDDVYDAFTSYNNEEGELSRFTDGEPFTFELKRYDDDDDDDAVFEVEVCRNTARIHNSVSFSTKYSEPKNDNGTVIDDPIEVIDDTAHICGIAIQAMLNTDA